MHLLEPCPVRLSTWDGLAQGQAGIELEFSLDKERSESRRQIMNYNEREKRSKGCHY